MQVKGIIKAVQAAVAAGGVDVTQLIKVEIFGEWKDLRDLMQRPLVITLEPSQIEFGKNSEGSVETSAEVRGKKKKSKDLVPA